MSNYDWNQNALSATSRADKGGSGVMLQAYNWNSCKLGKSWWKTIKSNSSMIKDKFEYVWFPPVSDSGSDNGYLPRQLNDLNSAYGSASDLIAAISARTKADILTEEGATTEKTETEPKTDDVAETEVTEEIVPETTETEEPVEEEIPSEIILSENISATEEPAEEVTVEFEEEAEEVVILKMEADEEQENFIPVENEEELKKHIEKIINATKEAGKIPASFSITSTVSSRAGGRRVRGLLCGGQSECHCR